MLTCPVIPYLHHTGKDDVFTVVMRPPQSGMLNRFRYCNRSGAESSDIMENENDQNMNLDQQIKSFEDRITAIEEYMRSGSGDPSQLAKDLDQAYQQVALLKIRKMMLDT